MERQGSGSPAHGRRRAWLIYGAQAVFLTVFLLLLLACLAGPDPRYLLLREGMTESQVRILMGKPDYYDEPIDGNGGSAWFYSYARSEIIVEWTPNGTV